MMLLSGCSALVVDKFLWDWLTAMEEVVEEIRAEVLSSTRCCGECPRSGEMARIVGNGEEKDLLAGAHVEGLLKFYVSLQIFRRRCRLQQQ